MIRRESPTEYARRMRAQIVHVVGPIVRQLARHDSESQRVGAQAAGTLCTALERLVDDHEKHQWLGESEEARYDLMRRVAFEFAYSESASGLRTMVEEYKEVFSRIASERATQTDIRKGIVFLSAIGRVATYRNY